jgi:hypothetical protein
MRSCMKAIGVGMFIVVAAVAGWFARDDISRFVSGLGGADSDSAAAASAISGRELARQVDAKVVALGQGEHDEVMLSVEELDAWVRYGLEGFFPGYISEVSVAIEEQRLVLSGLVAMKEVPGIEELGPAVAFFGDTAAVLVRGKLDGLGVGQGVFYVDDVQVGLLPLPDGVRDRLLAEIKTGVEADVPGNAVAFVLPRFVTDVGVREDRVFLRRE